MHPLLSTSYSWVWVAPSTTLTLWSLSRNWVSILKELRSLPPSSMCTLWTSLLNLSIPDVPFPVLLSTLTRSRFQAKPATLFIPIDFPFFFAVEELYGTRYQSGSFSLFYVGSGFHCACVVFLFFSFFFQLSSGTGFRSSMQPSWSPLIFSLILLVEEFYGTRYQSGSFSFINVGSGFYCLRNFVCY